MQETTADVRRDIEETRARVSAALAELNDEVADRRDAVKGRITGARDSVTDAAAQVQATITDFAREHPWYALGAALGIGVLISATGSDEAAVRGTVKGAQSAGSGLKSAAAGAARAGAAKAKALVGRDDEAASGAGVVYSHEPATGAIGSSAEDTGQLNTADAGGIFYRLQTGIVEAVGGSELLDEMRREARKFSSPA